MTLPSCEGRSTKLEVRKRKWKVAKQKGIFQKIFMFLGEKGIYLSDLK